MGFFKVRRPILSPNGSSEIAGIGIDFSLVEQDTGKKWIDGKTIYQKTVAVGLPNNSTASTAHGITGLDRFIQVVQGSYLLTSWHTLPRTGLGTILTDLVDVFVDDTNIHVRSTGDHSTSGTLAHVTIHYTKD